MTQDERIVAWYEKEWPPVYKKGTAEGLDALSAKDQILFLIGYLFNQLCDGGALFVYYNPSAKYVVSMAEALEKIGARRAAQVMRDINHYFPGERPSEDHDVRVKQLETLPKEASEKGAELERIFEEWLPGDGGRVMLKKLYDHCRSAKKRTQ